MYLYQTIHPEDPVRVVVVLDVMYIDDEIFRGYTTSLYTCRVRYYGTGKVRGWVTPNGLYFQSTQLTVSLQSWTNLSGLQ